MTLILDNCYIHEDTSDDTLSLIIQGDIVCYKLNNPISVLKNLSKNMSYKFWLKCVDDKTYSITKIEEIHEENIREENIHQENIQECDIAEPDLIEKMEIKNDLYKKMEDLIIYKQKQLNVLYGIKRDLGNTFISIEKIEEIYNKLNDCI